MSDDMVPISDLAPPRPRSAPGLLTIYVQPQRVGGAQLSVAAYRAIGRPEYVDIRANRSGRIRITPIGSNAGIRVGINRSLKFIGRYAHRFGFRCGTIPVTYERATHSLVIQLERE